jgi:hypothetical protein
MAWELPRLPESLSYLILFNFVDEHFNDARHTRATTSVISKVQIIWLGNYEPATKRYFAGCAAANARTALRVPCRVALSSKQNS